MNRSETKQSDKEKNQQRGETLHFTETYSPTTIDNAPATCPTTVTNTIGSLVKLVTATPIARPEIEIIPSFASRKTALS